jgi:RNA polymerase sigma-70 factor (ECF subfamily)
MDHSATSWESQIEAARQGDREALNSVFNELRGYFRRQAEQRLDAKLSVKTSPSDIVQETFLRAYEGIAGFEGKTRGELIAWVHGILRHRLLTAQRQFRGSIKRDLARERINSNRDVGVNGCSAPSQSSPSRRAIAKENAERLAAEIKQLPERQEQAIRLRNELHLSFEEVGQVMDCTADAAQKLWTRAVKQLSSRMKSRGDIR